MEYEELSKVFDDVLKEANNLYFSIFKDQLYAEGFFTSDYGKKELTVMIVDYFLDVLKQSGYRLSNDYDDAFIITKNDGSYYEEFSKKNLICFFKEFIHKIGFIVLKYKHHSFLEGLFKQLLVNI